jgi:TolB-like protein/Flp pilus assembly protein TadD
MAPELLRGRAPEPRADIFALGTMLYEMATGTRPFIGSSTLETMAAILRDDPVPPSKVSPQLPSALDSILLRTLHKDPLRRTRRALEVLDALRALPQRGGRVEQPSIAVLPFANLSAERDQDYFCEGIAEEILAALATVPGLRVASRATSFALRDSGLGSRNICQRLGVDSLLDGSLRKAGDELRIHVELVDGRDGCQLWSDVYERRLKDVFAIQEEIAEGVVRHLELTLSPHERRALRQVDTHDVTAYDYYLRGRRFYHQFRRQGMEFALQMYSRAIEVDPTYARAHAGIAQCSAFLFLTFDRDDRHRQRADDASRRALELDPQLPEAHSARGVALSISGRQPEAERAFETATRLDPNLFEVHYSWARQAFTLGEYERAIELYERAADLRPDDYQSPLLVAQIHDDLGRDADARAARERGVEIVSARLDLFPDDVRALYMGANGMVGLGRIAEGIEWASQARQLEPDEPLTLYNLGCIYAMAGEVDDAISCLTHAVDLGFAHLDWLLHDSNLDRLRSDPRFDTLLQRLPPSP